MNNIDAYPIEIRRLSEAEGGGFLASVLDLPGCHGDGETEAEAVADARDSIRAWIAAARKFGDPVPAPSQQHLFSGKFVTRLPKSLHMNASAAAKREGVSLNQFVVSTLAEAVGEKKSP